MNIDDIDKPPIFRRDEWIGKSINTFDSTSLQAYSWATNEKQHRVTYR
jgi:hypothetical protein